MPMVTIKGTEIDFRPMTPEVAAILRKICTELGLPTHCPFRACRRARRCATRQVLCHQALRQEINAIIRPVIREQAAKGPPDDDSASPVTAVTGRRVAQPAATR